MNALRKVFLKALGSFISAFVGCIAGAIIPTSALILNPDEATNGQALSSFGARFILFGGFALPVWALILLPLYLLIPRSSMLWRTPLCTVLGALGGAVVASLYLFLLMGGMQAVLQLWFLLIEGAVIGAATCLFGATTVDYFDRARS